MPICIYYFSLKAKNETSLALQKQIWQKVFRIGESNPGLLGESERS